MSPPEITTEQQVTDAKKTCRLFLCLFSSSVLEGGGYWLDGGGWVSEWVQDMLTLVAFPAIADVAPSVKCEAFKDLLCP